MSTEIKAIDTLVDEFESVLHDDILNLELSLLRLDELRAAIIKRDNDVLEALVGTIKIQSQDHQKLQDRRDKILRGLSAMFQIPVEKVTVSFLANHISDDKKDILFEKQKTAQSLIEKMRVEYAATFMLLQEFTRMNRTLLTAFTRPADNGVVYNSKGQSQDHQNLSMISGRF